jgi:hypothetical protein
MSELGDDPRTNARVREAADNAEQILSKANDMLAPSRRKLTDAIVHFTHQAPLHSLLIAFLLGVIIARRR